MKKKTNTNRSTSVMAAVSMVLIAAVTAFFAWASGSYVLYASTALLLVAAVAMAATQKWGQYVALLGLALLLGAFMEYKYEQTGRMSVPASLVLWVALAAGWYHRDKQQRKHHAATSRRKAPAAADALGALADGLEPEASPAAEPQADDESSHAAMRSLVILTKGVPAVDAATVRSRLGKWLGLQFNDGDQEAENFVVGDDRMLMVKLRGSSMYMVTMLGRCYWDSEDAAPYVAFGRLTGEEAPVQDARQTAGAILVDAHLGLGDETALDLAKIAMACCPADAKFLVSPAAVKVVKITQELAQALVKAQSPSQLLGPLCSVVPLPKGDNIYCKTMGMSLLGLPDILTRVEDNEEEFNKGMAAVQSVAHYQATRGSPLPDGDTCELPDCGTYRVSLGNGGTVCLVPIQA